MSRGIGGRTGQKGSQYGNGWRRWRFLTVEAGGRGGKISKAARLQDHTPGIARARPKFGGFWEFLEPLGGSRIMHAHTRPRRNDSPPKFARLNAHARKRRYFLRKPPYLEGNGLIQGITHPNGGKCLKRPKNSQSGGTLRGGGVYVCTRDDYPLFWTETNRGISGGFIPPQGMGIFRTETALFWTFPENMRDYTPNGLRVQNTGFFQKIITPGNRAFSRVRTVGRFKSAPVPEQFPPQLFQRYRLQPEPPPFWLIRPRQLGARIFPRRRIFQK